MTALFSIKQRFVYSYRLIKSLFLEGRSANQGLIFFSFPLRLLSSPLSQIRVVCLLA